MTLISAPLHNVRFLLIVVGYVPFSTLPLYPGQLHFKLSYLGGGALRCRPVGRLLLSAGPQQQQQCVSDEPLVGGVHLGVGLRVDQKTPSHRQKRLIDLARRIDAWEMRSRDQHEKGRSEIIIEILYRIRKNSIVVAEEWW